MTNHHALSLPGVLDAEDRALLESDVRSLADAFSIGWFSQLCDWPYPGGPRGPLILASGVPAHGAFVRNLDGGDIELCVANNGWPVELRTCPGPDPGPLPFLEPVSAWLSQQVTLVDSPGSVWSIPPVHAAIDRVAARAKPLALADTDELDDVRFWEEQARRHGLAHAVESVVFHDLGGQRCWFLAVARRESFDELLDLDAMLRYYESALVGRNAGPHAERVPRSLESLRHQSPVDFVDRAMDLVVAPLADSSPDLGCSTEVTGAVLGYWPPTSASLMLRSEQRNEATPLRRWNRFRQYLGDLAPRLEAPPCAGIAGSG
ncbi:MAG: hypothetical protein U5R31_11020 [Acidimicrobiia bacterium]|nr:hypothetical protein [Acidimicrobiia bacterium]